MSEELMSSILQGVEKYYTSRIQRHGATPAGVDWNGEVSQRNRFNQLMKVVRPDQDYTIADIGCGYGALFSHIRDDGRLRKYLGVDVSAEMIRFATSTFADSRKADFKKSDRPNKAYDYCVASGVFNVKLENLEDAWRDYVIGMLEVMNRYSKIGFAFNVLTSYSDSERMAPHLYYADPLFFFDFCKRAFARNVALLHDYDLYEFTIIVRKNT